MPDFYALSCPSCNAKLQVGKDLERFACGYCGNEIAVKRSGGIISLSTVLEEVKGVKAGVDKTASELALQRLNKELDTLTHNVFNLINRDLNQQNGYGAILSGKYNPCAEWFFTTMGTMPRFKAQMKSFTWSHNNEDVIVTVGGVSSKDILEVIEIARTKWKGNDQKAFLEFCEKLLHLKKSIEDCQDQIERHKKVLKS